MSAKVGLSTLKICCDDETVLSDSSVRHGEREREREREYFNTYLEFYNTNNYKLVKELI